LDELFTVAAELRARGITPIALGSNDPWPLGILLFENLLVSRGGSFYRQFFRGDVDALDEKMRGVVEDLGRLLSYTNLNAPLLTWTDAADLVRERKAAMTIMGDWTKAYFESKRGMPDVDFGSIPMPGTADTFVFTTDTFGLPLGSPDRQAALDLLELFGSAEGQNLFNPIKGSISPRKDADTSVYKDPMAQRTIADFQLAAMNPEMLVPATAIVTPPAYLHAIRPVLAQFAIDGNISVVLHALNNYADILQSSPLRDLL
jgi:glucose/mannose transport system substrate-binding protein